MSSNNKRHGRLATAGHGLIALGVSMVNLGMMMAGVAAQAQLITRATSEQQNRVQTAVFDAQRYNPAILSLSFSVKENDGSTDPSQRESIQSDDSFLDVVLITKDGQPTGRRVVLSKQALKEQLQKFYRQLARQEPMEVTDPEAPARRLYDAMIGPVAPVLEEQGITTLVIAAERGLQAVPFAALHSGTSYFGAEYAFSVTPSLQLTSLGPPRTGQGRMLAAGASKFTELAPLPLVEQELTRVETQGGVDRYLNQEFTPEVLLGTATENEYGYIHIATHAEFLPGGPDKAKIYSGAGAIPLREFSDVRQGRKDDPIDLFALSACRTAVGDGDSELGFAGLALQAGAKSAAGSLWYVDDVATSAFYVQFYRYLQRGLPKAEAMQQVRVDLLNGRMRREGDQMMGPENVPVLTGLSKEQQRRVSSDLKHPFFWGGIELLGVPW